VKQVSKILRR